MRFKKGKNGFISKERGTLSCNQLLSMFWGQKLKKIVSCFDNMECNGNYCGMVLCIKHMLLLYHAFIKICKVYNQSIKFDNFFNNDESDKILNMYYHILRRHKHFYKNTIYKSCIFRNVCNNSNNCEYIKTYESIKRISILDRIHTNIIHHDYSISNQKNYYRFITQIPDHLPEYDCGVQMNYHGYLCQSNKMCVPVKYKYFNLKEEILYPNKLQYQAWNEDCQKATKLSQRMDIRHIKAHNDTILTSSTNIHDGEIISEKHILAIILYTDNDILCYNFRKIFRYYDDFGNIKPMDKIIDDHSEYSHWGKLLFECVHVFGNNIGFDTEYYHGVNKRFIFSSLIFNVQMPMSTSTSIDVANAFTGSNAGMTITLKNKYKLTNHNHRCLPVKRFSKFDYEEEVLFFSNGFIITGVYVQFNLQNQFPNDLCTSYLLLSCILNGYYIENFTNYDSQDILSDQVQQSLINFINYIRFRNQTNPYFKYYELCLRSLIKRRRRIIINKDCMTQYMKRLKSDLIELLFSDKEKCIPGEMIRYICEECKRFIYEKCLHIHISCNPIQFDVPLIQVHSLVEYHYILITKTGIQVQYKISIEFIHKEKQICVKIKIYPYYNPNSLINVLYAWIAIFLSCPSLNIYINADIYGNNGSHYIASIIDADLIKNILYTFNLSVCLIGQSTKDVQSLDIVYYDFKYGTIYFIYIQSYTYNIKNV